MVKQYKFENITFNIDALDEEFEEFQGASTYKFTVEKPVEDLESFIEGGGMGDVTLEDFEWGFNKFTFSTYNTDHFVLVLSYFLEQKTKGVTVDYEGLPFWLAHDIGHAKNDVICNCLYTDEYREMEAHRFAMLLSGRRKMHELFGSIVPSKEYRVKMAKEYYDRFKNHEELVNLLKVLRITNSYDEILYPERDEY